MTRKIHETATSFIVYEGDRIAHQCLNERIAKLVQDYGSPADGTDIRQGAARADGEHVIEFRIRRARAMATFMQEGLTQYRRTIMELKAIPGCDDLLTMEREHRDRLRTAMRRRLFIAKKLP